MSLDIDLLINPEEKIVATTRPHWVIFAGDPIGNIALIILLSTGVYLNRSFINSSDFPSFLILLSFALAIFFVASELFNTFILCAATRYYLTTHRFIVISGNNLLSVSLEPGVKLFTNASSGTVSPAWGSLMISGAGATSISWAIRMPNSTNRANKFQLNMKGAMQAGCSLKFDRVAAPKKFLHSLTESHNKTVVRI